MVATEKDIERRFARFFVRIIAAVALFVASVFCFAVPVFAGFGLIAMGAAAVAAMSALSAIFE